MDTQPWYKHIPNEAFANPRLDEIFRLQMIKSGKCVVRTKIKGNVSDERYHELESVLVNQFGFTKAEKYYRFPSDEEEEFDGYDELTDMALADTFKQTEKEKPYFVSCSLFLSDNGYLAYQHGGEVLNSSITITMGKDELSDDFIKTIKNFFVQTKEVSRPIKMFTSINGEFDITDVGNVGLKLIRENYPSKVLEGYDRVVDTLLSNNNKHGSIVILEGEPGTGKSFLIRGLMESLKATFIFIPTNSVENLVNPAVIPLLLTHYELYDKLPIILIIEDGDETILSRSTRTNSLISTVLNMGDGILGEILHIKMIISTNIPKADIDKAVMRPGRLNAYIEVPKLDKDKATEVYKRLTDKEFDFKDKQIALADVYAKANESQNMFKKDKKVEDGGRYA